MKNIQIQHCCPACEEISGADTTQCPKCNMRLGKVSTKNTINRYIHILEQGPANTPEDGVYTEQLMIAGLVNAVGRRNPVREELFISFTGPTLQGIQLLIQLKQQRWRESVLFRLGLALFGLGGWLINFSSDWLLNFLPT